MQEFQAGFKAPENYPVQKSHRLHSIAATSISTGINIRQLRAQIKSTNEQYQYVKTTEKFNILTTVM